jgi:hypothetical protein
MLGAVGFLITVGNPSRPLDCVQSLALKAILFELKSFIKVVVLNV